MNTDTDENVVEPDVTGFGNPSLDSDRIDDATESQIDDLLDEVIKEQEGETTNENTEEIESDVSLNDTEPAEATETPAPVQEPVAAEPEVPKLDIDPEIAAIEQPRNLSEKNQSNWRKLQETASTYKKQAQEAEHLRQKLSELETNKQVEVPQDYEELKKFRQIFDIKNDPDFVSKYAKPIDSAKQGIYGILRKHGASEDVIESIEKVGGPDKIDDKFWMQDAFKNLPLTDSEKLKRNLVDVADLREKQDEEVKYAADHAEDILKEREMEKGNWYTKEITEIDQEIDNLTKELPWARFAEAPANATPDQLKQVETHNARVADLANRFESALWPTTAKDRANIAAAAVFSHVLTDQLRTEQTQKSALLDQVKKLTTENNALKGAGKMPKQTSAAQTSSRPANNNDRIKMNSSDAIDLGLDEALGS